MVAIIGTTGSPAGSAPSPIAMGECDRSRLQICLAADNLREAADPCHTIVMEMGHFSGP